MIDIGIGMSQKQRGQSGGSPPPPPPPSTHVFIVAGQSNSVGRTTDNGGAFPAGVMEWSASDSWDPIGSRLFHGPWSTSVAQPSPGATFGFARSFAASYLAENPGVTLHLVGVGQGGTGFTNNQWNKGDPAYAQAVARANAALSAAPAGATLQGILWHQGEADAKTPAARAAYAGALSSFISDFRSDIAAASVATPFVLGGHFLKISATYDTSLIQNAIQAMSNVFPYTGYADPSSPVEAILTDGAHIDAASSERFGLRYHIGLKEAQTNTALSQGGAITTGTWAHHDLPASTTAQVSNVALGAADPHRMIVLALAVRGNFGPQPQSVSVGGIDLQRMGFPTSGNGAVGLTLFTGYVPEGTTGDVDVTFDSVPRSGQVGFGLLPVYGARPALGSAGGFARHLETSGPSTALDVAVDAAAGDLIFTASGSLSNPAASGSFDLATTSSAAFSGGNVALHAGWEVKPSGILAPRSVNCSYDRAVQVTSLSALVLKPL